MHVHMSMLSSLIVIMVMMNMVLSLLQDVCQTVWLCSKLPFSSFVCDRPGCLDKPSQGEPEVHRYGSDTLDASARRQKDSVSLLPVPMGEASRSRN